MIARSLYLQTKYGISWCTLAKQVSVTKTTVFSAMLINYHKDR